MKIWGRINSTNVRKVLWCAEELNLIYESIPAGGEFGVVNEPAYLERNPNGRIPCLEDEGLVLWESNVIVRYLGKKYGQQPFIPADIQSWYAAEKWMDWASFSFGMPFRNLFWNLVRHTPEQRKAEIAISMDRKGAWRDNVFVERLWRSIKYEEVYLYAYKTVSEARVGIGRYLIFYNSRRPHSSLDQQTPDQVYFNALTPIMVAA